MTEEDHEPVDFDSFQTHLFAKVFQSVGEIFTRAGALYSKAAEGEIVTLGELNLIAAKPESHKRKKGPKRGPSAFNLFAKDERAQLLSENPGIKMLEQNKLLSLRWKNIDPTRKQEYEQASAEAKRELLEGDNSSQPSTPAPFVEPPKKKQKVTKSEPTPTPAPAPPSPTKVVPKKPQPKPAAASVPSVKSTATTKKPANAHPEQPATKKAKTNAAPAPAKPKPGKPAPPPEPADDEEGEGEEEDDE